MHYMFEAGFLGTRAPFFMDAATVTVASLPLLVYLAILAARRGYYGLHRAVQWGIFVLTILVVAWFEYGVRVGGGFSAFSARSTVNVWVQRGILGGHVLIALVTLCLWVGTLVRAERNYRQGNLPGGYTLRHVRRGLATAVGIFLTALSGVWVYLILFVFGR
ncbi:DUF420 domain-containing protein [Nitratifractor sp.]